MLQLRLISGSRLTDPADGKQVAKQIFIFPAELRGAAEGGVPTDPPGATSHSRMTNGTISHPSAFAHDEWNSPEERRRHARG